MPNNKKQTASGKRKIKTVVAREGGFSIRSKGQGFIVQIRRKGIRETKTFATLEAAKLHCQSLHATVLNDGLAGFALGPRQRDDAVNALKLLGERASLTAAAQTWLRLNPAGDALTVADLFKRTIADMEHRGRRAKTLQGRRQFLDRFAKDYGTRPASSIVRAEIEEWLATRIPERSFNTLRMSLHAAFAYGVHEKIMDANPVAGIRPKQFDRGEPTFWPVATVENVMREAAKRDAKTTTQQAAWKVKPSVPWLPITPYLALQAFGGLRPDEAARLDWSNVNFSTKLIRLPAAASKVRRARLVPMDAALIAWLAPYRKDAGPITPCNATTRNARRAILVSAGLPAGWPQDVLRHSFATHWMAAHAHEGRLAEILGNSPAIVQRHYKGLTTAKEGRKYFKITPVSEGKIIKMRAA